MSRVTTRALPRLSRSSSAQGRDALVIADDMHFIDVPSRVMPAAVGLEAEADAHVLPAVGHGADVETHFLPSGVGSLDAVAPDLHPGPAAARAAHLDDA